MTALAEDIDRQAREWIQAHQSDWDAWLAEARAAAGQAVDFVLWFNFLAGFAYVAVGLGLWRRRRWAVHGAALLALATASIAVLFGLHVLSGGAYELRTVGALTLRLSFWSALALVARRAAQSTTR